MASATLFHRPAPDQVSYDEEVLARSLAVFDEERPGGLIKGIPASYGGSFGDIGKAGFSLSAGNLPLPVAIIKQSALDANRRWMREFLRHSGAVIAPHGKTTMTPRLFQMQLEDGAWGLTAATAQHVVLYAQLGVKRIILANQLTGAANIGMVLDVLAADESLDFYCLVDSADNARGLSAAAQARGLGRPLQVLVEIGALGGRTGVRGVDAAFALARGIHAAAPALSLRGIEAYEGVFGGLSEAEKDRRVRGMLGDVAELATRSNAAGLFGAGPVILTAGGSEFFDLAGLGLADWAAAREHVAVIRSGCYLTHDDLAYERAYRRLLQRSPALAGIAPEMRAAVEVWGAVQSCPEPGIAFATLGKRDISYDFEMPVPLHWLRPGQSDAPARLNAGHRVTKLNDQHAYLELPGDSPLRVGDMVGFGVSHVCTTFDKWKSLLLVDDVYRVTGAVRTFF